jgi:hypothetical protein
MKSPHWLICLGLFTLGACGGDVTPPDDANATYVIAQYDGDQQIAPVATPLPTRVAVRVTDKSGRGVPGVRLQFWVSSGGGWVLDDEEMLTDASGDASTVWYMGPRAGTANILGVTSEVGGTGFRAYTTGLVPGLTYGGIDGHVELRFGALPLMIGVAHGGSRTPADVVDQDADASGDAGTIELAGEIERTFADRAAAAPTVLVSHLARTKVELDGDLAAAQRASPLAERTWREYHGLLEAVRVHHLDRDVRALYLDLHGHGSADGAVQLGYLLSAADLASPDALLNGSEFVLKSSIRDVARREVSFARLIRGETSLGGLLADRGYPAVPSPDVQVPTGTDYAAASFSTTRYGSQDGGLFSAAVLQTPATIRATETGRASFAAALANSIDAYFELYYDGALSGR